MSPGFSPTSSKLSVLRFPTWPTTSIACSKPAPTILPAVLTELVDGLHVHDQRVTPVVDDWRHVTGADSVAAIRFLLEHGCHHLPLVTTTTTAARSDLPVCRLRMHGVLTEIDAATLLFDAGEVRHSTSQTMCTWPRTKSSR